MEKHPWTRSNNNQGGALVSHPLTTTKIMAKKTTHTEPSKTPLQTMMDGVKQLTDVEVGILAGNIDDLAEAYEQSRVPIDVYLDMLTHVRLKIREINGKMEKWLTNTTQTWDTPQR